MRKILFYYSIVATVLLIIGVTYINLTHHEVKRLRNNNESLANDIELYRTRFNDSAASVIALQLTLDEFRQQQAKDAELIRRLGIRLRRAESITAAATRSEVSISAPIVSSPSSESLLTEESLLAEESPRIFEWSDRWVNIEGVIKNDSVECRIRSIDTLHQVIHRVPHRWWIFRYGTRAIRQEILSSNPHTQIVYAKYIELPKRHRRR